MNTVKRGNRFMFLLLLVFIIGSLVYGIILHEFNLEPTTVINLLVAQIGFVTIPSVLYFIITKSPVKKTLRLYKLDTINTLILIGFGLTVQPLLSFINLVSQLFFTNYIAASIGSLMALPYPYLLILTAIIPAINEEITTRGILLANYKHVNIFSTAIVSGLFFGMFHLNINQFSYAFVMGILLCLFVEITGSIYSAMIIHFTINATQVTLQKILFDFMDVFEKYTDIGSIIPQEISRSDIMSIIPATLGFALFITPFAFLLLYLAIRYNKKSYLFTKKANTISDNTVREKIFTPHFIVSIVLFLSYVLIFEVLLL